VRGADVGSGLTALRVLLAADLLARVAELGGLQVLTALAIDDPAAAPAALERDAGALGIHPPTVRTTSRDAPSSLGGPIDVRLVTRDALDHRLDGLAAVVDTAYLGRAGGRTGARDGSLPAAPGSLPAGPSRDPLTVRLTLMSFPISLAAGVTGEALDRAGETLGSWRQQVARWASPPGRYPHPSRGGRRRPGYLTRRSRCAAARAGARRQRAGGRQVRDVRVCRPHPWPGPGARSRPLIILGRPAAV
jgi:hypothetical protein